ncbi:protein of unknown function (plasmid) [Cupriavidus taiwanensis]|uniref:Transposase n=1 Tax=Cupriavidus taiwanensis TaxID=164546 RepID=A0A375EBG0_9BURK|nr:protein of unknown function [Cupriavidus taiwanensis]SOZ72160.1 protein of unknown function [Cupriavidus taiwanensis]SOZ74458.1 protein of unknown function [Cupriavidus taiwanensis]SPA11378.1 protein of unknown function [Cupriavidus taiwanensis]
MLETQEPAAKEWQLRVTRVGHSHHLLATQFGWPRLVGEPRGEAERKFAPKTNAPWLRRLTLEDCIEKTPLVLETRERGVVEIITNRCSGHTYSSFQAKAPHTNQKVAYGATRRLRPPQYPYQ